MASKTTGSHPIIRNPTIRSEYACFRLRADRSRIHRWGVYAAETIPHGRKVIEYTGEKINRREAKRRWHTRYLFQLDAYWTLDGAVGGSGAELINHSCEPNLETRILKGHILYFSRRRIRKGEELTVDYNYDETDERLRCVCGTKTCRGTINVL
ncbi:MAG TPA: SET domain-containing protein-lysine N-methyltransferase [Terriglobia bacterium]|nr:SET domain-containing protein-lysine N-methyltransferase [Terriglobia bacterium]